MSEKQQTFGSVTGKKTIHSGVEIVCISTASAVDKCLAVTRLAVEEPTQELFFTVSLFDSKLTSVWSVD